MAEKSPKEDGVKKKPFQEKGQGKELSQKETFMEEARLVDKTFLFLIIGILTLGIITTIGISAYRKSVETVVTP